MNRIFAHPSYYQLACFRIMYCGVALVDLVITGGLSRAIHLPLNNLYGPGNNYFEILLYSLSPFDVLVTYLIALVLAIIGVFTRGALALAFACAAWIYNLAPIYSTSTLALAQIWTFYLLLAPSSRRLSLMNYWSTGNVRFNSFVRCMAAAESSLANVVGNLIKIQISIIYIYSAIAKLMSPEWRRGEAISIALASRSVINPIAQTALEYPGMLATATLLTIGLELLIPMLLWIRGLRVWGLAMGVLFHFASGIVMGIPTFALSFLPPYLLFFRSRENKGLN